MAAAIVWAALGLWWLGHRLDAEVIEAARVGRAHADELTAQPAPPPPGCW